MSLFRLLLVFATLMLSAAAHAADAPVLRLEAEGDRAVPGQSIVLRLTVLVPTWMVEPPVFPSLEVANALVRLPSRATAPTSERIQGETWSGVSRTYRLYPMIAGRFRIPPQPLIVTYSDPQTRQPRRVSLTTPELVFFGVVPEAGRELDPFIAAEALSLEQSIEGKLEDLVPGDAVTRIVTARGQGLLPLALPPLLRPVPAEGLAAYPKEPVVNQTEADDVLSGDRVESVTYVAEAGGRFSLPPVRLDWYNLAENRVETLTVPGIDLAVSGPPPMTAGETGWRRAALWVAGGLVMLALWGLVLARRLAPRLAAWRQQRRYARHQSEAFASAQVLAGLRATDYPATLRAVAVWRARIPAADTGPEARLDAALARLSAALYGAVPGPHSGRDWSDAKAAFVAARQSRTTAIARQWSSHGLPPLNPARPA